MFKKRINTKNRMKEKMKVASKKELNLALLSVNDQCFAYNEKQDIPIWNYMLSEDKTNLFIFDENDKTIYDGLVKDVPDELFWYGDIFSVADFTNINIPENIVTRDNVWLFLNKIINKKRN